MKRTEQATEGLSWGIREREESAWEGESDSILRTSQPASREGRAAKRGGSTGAEQRLGQGTEGEGPQK